MQKILVPYLPSTLDLYCQLEAAGGSPGHLARLFVTEPNSILLSFPIQIIVQYIFIVSAKHEAITRVSKASGFYLRTNCKPLNSTQFHAILCNFVHLVKFARYKCYCQVHKFIYELTKSWCKHPLLFLSIPEQEHCRLFRKQKSSSL